MKSFLHVAVSGVGGIGKTPVAEAVASCLELTCEDFIFYTAEGSFFFNWPDTRMLRTFGSKNVTGLDPAFECLLGTENSAVLDVAPTSYLTFLNYLREDVLDREELERMVIHVPFKSDCKNSLKSLKAINDLCKGSKIIVWCVEEDTPDVFIAKLKGLSSVYGIVRSFDLSNKLFKSRLQLFTKVLTSDPGTEDESSLEWLRAKKIGMELGFGLKALMTSLHGEKDVPELVLKLSK